MNVFLFEQYGFYPGELENNEFFINGFEYRLIEVEVGEDEISKKDQYCTILNSFYGDELMVKVIKNKSSNYISYYNGKKYCLLSILKKDMIVNDLNVMHVKFKNYESLDLFKIMNLWKTRSDYIENVGVASLRVDSIFYGENLEKSLFGLGLCQNAIQYLNEVIHEYGSNFNGLTLTHKRLKNLCSFDFFNPFNIVLDHPIRDLVELYKNDFFTVESLVEVLKFYEIDSKIASLFLSRLLYPSSIFDQIENSELSNSNKFKIDFNIEKECVKIKNVYTYFRKKYNIRPISWLEN